MSSKTERENKFMDKTQLTAKIKEMVLKDIDLVGITTADHLSGAPEGRRPIDVLPGAKSVIVGAIHLLDSVIEDLPYSRYEYTEQFFVLNALLNSMTFRVSRFLESLGYRSHPVPAAYPRVNKEVCGILSHRHAAVMAGLGELALNNMLTTPEYGARVRLVSIVTEAPLDPDHPLREERCKELRNICKLACVNICPVKALTPEGEIKKHVCLHYQEQIMPWSAAELRCGMCISVCPLGKKEWLNPKSPRPKPIEDLKAKWTGAVW